MKIADLIREVAQQLLPLYEQQETAVDNAWWIVQTITGLTKTELILKQQIELSETQQATRKRWMQQLIVEQIPLQYLIGTVPFLNLTLTVKPPILIPRPETEAWVAELVDKLTAQKKIPQQILDLCTGSGCIGLALAQAFPQSTVYLADIQPAAIALAQTNAQHALLTNVHCLLSDLFAAVPQTTYDLIVANPPYISLAEWYELAPQVKVWEDRTALLAEDDGYAVLAKIIKQAPAYLSHGGMLCVEIGYKQGSRVAHYFAQAGFHEVRIAQDIQHKERMVQGIWSPR